MVHILITIRCTSCTDPTGKTYDTYVHLIKSEINKLLKSTCPSQLMQALNICSLILCIRATPTWFRWLRKEVEAWGARPQPSPHIIGHRTRGSHVGKTSGQGHGHFKLHGGLLACLISGLSLLVCYHYRVNWSGV